MTDTSGLSVAMVTVTPVPRGLSSFVDISLQELKTLCFQKNHDNTITDCLRKISPKKVADVFWRWFALLTLVSFSMVRDVIISVVDKINERFQNTFQPCPSRRLLPLILLMDHGNSRILSSPFTTHLFGAAQRTIIDQNDLQIPVCLIRCGFCAQAKTYLSTLYTGTITEING